jgi:hypothetical protein
MFKQVIMTIFDLMIDFEYLWKDTSESLPSSIFGFGLGIEEKPPVVNVDLDALYNSFLSGFDRYGEVWEKIIPHSELKEVKRLRDISREKFYYPTNLWARLLCAFAVAYRNNQIPQEQIIESMTPFYHSRILSFVNKTNQKDAKECEEYFENILRVFEKEKDYLIKRWDQDQRKLGKKLFG